MNIAGRSIRFDEAKSSWLRNERGIGLDEIAAAIESGEPFSINPHPNPKYPHQLVGEIVLKNYVYVVPFVVEKSGGVFLKTLYPSRKATKKRHKESKA